MDSTFPLSSRSSTGREGGQLCVVIVWYDNIGLMSLIYLGWEFIICVVCHAQIALTPIRDKMLICQTFRSILRPSSVAMYKNQAAVSIYNLGMQKDGNRGILVIKGG